MPEPHCRHIQVHLSTAIVLMFVAGGLLWANLKERTPNDFDLGDFATGLVTSASPPDAIANPGRTCAPLPPVYGWPMAAVFYKPETYGLYEDLFIPPEYQFAGARAAVDLAMALAMLLSVGSLCEWRIRSCRRRV